MGVTTMQTRKQYIEELEMETFDLIAKIVGILKEHNLWEPDGTYTFKDGDRWSRFEPEVEEQYLDYVKDNNEEFV